MKLFMFEHCSLCFRVRMTAALKRLHLQETVVLDDDSETARARNGLLIWKKAFGNYRLARSAGR